MLLGQSLSLSLTVQSISTDTERKGRRETEWADRTAKKSNESWEIKQKREWKRFGQCYLCDHFGALCVYVCVWGHLGINPVTSNILINYQWWNIAQQAWAVCVWERKCVQWPWEKGADSRLLDTLKTAIDFNGENLEPFQPLHPIKLHFTHTFRHTHTHTVHVLQLIQLDSNKGINSSATSI